MSMTVHCDIVSAEEKICSGLVQQLSVSGSEGELGVQYGHAPLLTAIKPGPVRITTQDGEQQIYFITGGFLEVQPHTVTVLADVAVRAEDIDAAAAEEAQREAQKALEDASGEMDYSRAAAQLAEATAQIRTLHEMRRKMGKNN